MGCWNGTCAVSNLHITYGDKVVVLLLAKNRHVDSFCYNNALYNLCYVPFYGEYNDYGAVEECHGIGLNIIVESLRQQLYKFGQGSNSVHDIEVNKDNFDIDRLFEADHEDRLGIHDTTMYDPREYEIRQLKKIKDDDGLTDSQQYELDRLASVLAQKDDFQQVTHIQVRKDIFDAIMEKWYVEDYVGDGKGNSPDDKDYNREYFADVVASIPEYVKRIKKQQQELEEAQKDGDPNNKKLFSLMFKDQFVWNGPCLAGRYLQSLINDHRNQSVIVNIRDTINTYRDAKDWDGLATFAKDVLSIFWLNSFMSHTRKVWTKQCGAGSQNSEHLGYKVLANAVLDVLKEEDAERRRWNDEEEEDVEDDHEA